MILFGLGIVLVSLKTAMVSFAIAYGATRLLLSAIARFESKQNRRIVFWMYKIVPIVATTVVIVGFMGISHAFGAKGTGGHVLDDLSFWQALPVLGMISFFPFTIIASVFAGYKLNRKKAEAILS